VGLLFIIFLTLKVKKDCIRDVYIFTMVLDRKITISDFPFLIKYYCLRHLFWFVFWGFFFNENYTDPLNLNISQLKLILS